MGRDMRTLSVSATLSSHNSEEDDRDEALWEQLRSRIEELCNEPAFKPIGAMVC